MSLAEEAVRLPRRLSQLNTPVGGGRYFLLIEEGTGAELEGYMTYPRS
jgi:hypothetical protein